MKVVILAGGLGTRIMEKTDVIPKPMIEIGGMPIMWHIMKLYSHYGFNDFIICLGYKGDYIKRYFLNYYNLNSNIEIDLSNNKVSHLSSKKENFKIKLIDTGLQTNTAGRISRIREYVGDQFMLTYGDGVSNINLEKLIEFHSKNNSIATLTSVKNPSRFGDLQINEDNKVLKFIEKPEDHNNWINAGYFVLNREVFNYLNFENVDDVQWEKGPLKKIASDGMLSTYKHNGFWKPMDAMRDKIELEKIWKENPKWKVW